MEKISSIVQSTSQAKVDMSKERPVRAGAPSYGQPVSNATKTFEKVKKEEEQMSPVNALASQKKDSPDDLRHTGIIDKITLSFKGNSERLKPNEQVINLSSVQALSAEPENSEVEIDLSEGVETSTESSPQRLDLYA